MSFEERYEGFCVDLIKVNIIYLSRDNQGMSLRRDTRDSARISYLSRDNKGNVFEERYEGFCVDLIKVNLIYLSRENRGNVFCKEI